MAEIDFQSILDGMDMEQAPGDPISSIYEIIPTLDSVQIEILFQVSYFINRWHLEDLEQTFERFIKMMGENKSLSFMSSKTLKDLLSAYTQNEMIRGISVRANSKDKDTGVLG